MHGSRLASYGALLLRLGLGTLALAHAYLKVVILPPHEMIQYFSSLGLPPEAYYVTVCGETLGGLALIFGVLTRLAALAMTPILIGTIVTVHGANGWLFDNKGGGWEFPAFWTLALVVQALVGSGPFALGTRIFKRR